MKGVLNFRMFIEIPSYPREFLLQLFDNLFFLWVLYILFSCLNKAA